MALTEEQQRAIREAAQKRLGRELRPSPYEARPGLVEPALAPARRPTPAIRPAPAPKPEPQPTRPEIVYPEEGGSGYWNEQGDWVWITYPTPVFPIPPVLPKGMEDIEDWLAQYAPTAPTLEPLTPEKLLRYVDYAMALERGTEGQRVYDDATVFEAIERIEGHIAQYGFGTHTPYYGAALEYYANIASVESAFNTPQMSPSDYMEFQVAIMQMVNSQNIAQFQAQVEQTMWGAQLQLSYQQLAAQLQTAMLPYQQMTVWQQAQLEQAGEVTPLAEAQLELERELAYLPYEQMTAAQRAQAELARLPYGQMTAWQQQQATLQEQERALAERALWLPYQQMTAAQQAQLAQQMQLAQLPYGAMTAYQETQAALEQQALAQQMQLAQLPYEQMTAYQETLAQQAQQNYLAQLAAQPRSWLEYAAAAGETPVLQPWQMPLMPQQYQGLQAGQPIPGWAPESGMGMPQLTTPSRQYQARIGPTAQQQYLGYEQARTGALPSETEFRLWSAAPPSGVGSRLRYER